MRILFLSNAKSVHTVRWVNALVERGHDVYLLFKKDDCPISDEISSKVKLFELKYSGSKGYYLNALELNKLYKKIRPDIVNAHYASGYGTLARLAKVKPLLLSVWGSDVYNFPYQSRINMEIIKKNINYAHKIASTSNCMADQVRRLMNKQELDINITPFGVDIGKFSKSGNLKDNAKEKIIIGIVKSLSLRYGIDDLIKAFKILNENLIKDNLEIISNRLELHIYGDGEQKEELINLTKLIGVEQKVYFKGILQNDKVPEALESMDIFCATSIEESFGVAVVEAMAMELPVVATNAEGFKEVIVDNITGIIVEKQNPHEIARGLFRVIMDKDLRNKLGKQGRERVTSLYNWEDNVTMMEKIYNDLLGQLT